MARWCSFEPCPTRDASLFRPAEAAAAGEAPDARAVPKRASGSRRRRPRGRAACPSAWHTQFVRGGIGDARDAPATPAGGVAETSRERAVAGSPALPAGGAGRLACSLDRDAVSAPALKSCGARDPHARACAFQSSHWHTREQ